MIPFDDLVDESVKIDLLLDGELPAEERRTLFLRLDTAPDGWKRCALAFLEAQAWREAFQEPSRVVMPKPSVHTQPKNREFSPWLARAAVVITAFGLGWAARLPGGDAVKPAMAVIPAISKPAASLKMSPVVAQNPSPHHASPNYVEGLLEREGYRVERSRILVPATKNGRQFAVPVERVQVRFVGNRSV